MSTVIKGSASGQINLNDTTGSIQLNGSDVLTIDSSGNVTIPNNLNVTGTPPTPAANSIGATELNVSGNGTSGQVLTSDADGSFSWADAAGGAWELISEGSNTSFASTQNFTGLSGYKFIRVYLRFKSNSTSNAQLALRFSSNNGSSWITSGYYYSAHAFLNAGSFSYANNEPQAILTYDGVGSVTAFGVPLVLDIQLQPYGAYQSFLGPYPSYGNTNFDSMYTTIGSGINNTSATPNAFQLFISARTISLMEYKVLGVA